MEPGQGAGMCIGGKCAIMGSRRTIILAVFALAVLIVAPQPACAQDRATGSISKTVRVGVLQNFPPHYVTESTTGKPGGFAVEFMNAVAERAGLTVVYVVFPTWPRLSAALRARRIDIIANMGITEARAEWAAFTVPIQTYPVSIFIRDASTGIRSADDLSGRRVSVRTGDVGVSLMRQRGDVDLVVHDNWEQALSSLQSGTSDALVHPKYALLRLAREAGLAGSIKVVEPPLVEITQAIGVRPDRPKLLALLNATISRFLPTSDYHEIFRKWYGGAPSYWNIGRIFILMTSLMVVMALGFVYWRYRSLLRVNARLSGAIADREQTQRTLQTMISTSPDGIITIDARGDVLSFNPAAGALFNYTESEVVGRNVNILMPEPYRGGHDGYMARYLETGEKRIIGIGREVVAQRKDGSTFPIELAVGEMEIDGQKQFTGFIRDVTQRREAEDQLATSENRLMELQSEFVHVSRLSAMGEMAATLAHELNQPLSAMMNYAQATRRILQSSGGEEAERLRDLMTKAVGQANRAGEIIRRLRSFVAQGESERLLEDINDVVNEACALALVGARSDGVETTLVLPDDLPSALMDRVQIQQVLVNLIRNSLDATVDQESRVISITTERGEEGGIAVSVADNGPGLDKEVAERLFQPFNSSKSEGMGIGLSISRTIVEQHGGRIWATPRDGGGMIFSFTLPVDA